MCVSVSEIYCLTHVWAGSRVLHSASELFAVIKKSLLRCSKYITRGPAMLALMATFQVPHPPRSPPPILSRGAKPSFEHSVKG